jgi:hypothetical protein
MLQRGALFEGNAAFIPPDVDARQCWGFMAAVQEASALADPGYLSFRGNLIPEALGRLTLINFAITNVAPHVATMPTV